MEFVRAWEAGNVDDPADSGGRTSDGIIQSVYNRWLKSRGKPNRDVFQSTHEEKLAVYWEFYWCEGDCGRFDWPLSLAYFDTWVNFGPRGDGVKTMGANNFLQNARVKVGDNPLELAREICKARWNFRAVRVSARPSQQRFLRGWQRRDEDLLKYVDSGSFSGP